MAALAAITSRWFMLEHYLYRCRVAGWRTRGSTRSPTYRVASRISGAATTTRTVWPTTRIFRMFQALRNRREMVCGTLSGGGKIRHHDVSIRVHGRGERVRCRRTPQRTRSRTFKKRSSSAGEGRRKKEGAKEGRAAGSGYTADISGGQTGTCRTALYWNNSAAGCRAATYGWEERRRVRRAISALSPGMDAPRRRLRAKSLATTAGAASIPPCLARTFRGRGRRFLTRRDLSGRLSASVQLLRSSLITSLPADAGDNSMGMVRRWAGGPRGTGPPPRLLQNYP